MSVERTDLISDEHGLRGCTAQEAIELIYVSSPSESEASEREVLVLSKQGEARWLIDMAANRGLDRVWRDWIPYSRKSQLAWWLIRTAGRLRLLSRSPGVDSLRISVRGLAAAVEQWPTLQGCMPIVFIGKPSITAKLTLFMTRPSGEIAGIVKIPLTRSAAHSIVTEAKAIGELGAKMTGVPKLLGLDQTNGISVQSWLPGRAVSRDLKKRQIDFLLALPRSEDRISLRTVTDVVITSLRPEYRERCAKYLYFLNPTLSVFTVWEHGDFVPWNMKEGKIDHLQLVDWEYSQSSGLPLLDLCHFFYRQDYLFGDIGPISRILISNPLARTYCSSFGLGVEHIRALQLHYLIRSFRMDVPNSSTGSSYVQYLFQRIDEIPI